MTWTVTIGELDVSNWAIDNVIVYWGREDLYRQPDPATCTFSILRSSSIGIIDPLDIQIGAEVYAYPTLNSVEKYRFYGTVTDVTVNWYTIDVVAVSPAARWPSYTEYVDLAPAFEPGPIWDLSETSTGVKVSQILSDLLGTSAVEYDTGELKVGFWYDQPATVDWWTALQAVVAGEPFGVLCEDMTLGPAGAGWQAYFTDAYRRRNTTPDLTLTGDEIIRDWQVTKTVGDKVNYLTTSVPAHPAGWWPETSTNWDQPADIDNRRYTGELTPTYSSPDSVRNLATSMIGLWRLPTYRLRRVSIPMSALTETRQAAILDQVRMSNLVSIPEILPGFPTLYFVEGCQDTYVDGKYVLTLFLSDTALSHPPDRWEDASGTLEWGQVSAILTWGDAYMERII